MSFESSTWGHLRFPINVGGSVLFLFPLSQSPQVIFQLNTWIVYLAVHVFLLPATTAYNGYYDRDLNPVVGYTNPTPVTNELLYVSILFDLIALVLGGWVSTPFFLYILTCVLLSKAYSHPSIRLKNRPIFSWIFNVFCYGYLTPMAVQIGLTGLGALHEFRHHLVSLNLCTIMAILHITSQVFQHEEDKKRGDTSASILLGIPLTVSITGFLLLLMMGGMTGFFLLYYPLDLFLLLEGSWVTLLTPLVLYIINWSVGFLKGEKKADFKTINRVMILANSAFIVFFSWLTIYSYLYFSFKY